MGRPPKDGEDGGVAWARLNGRRPAPICVGCVPPEAGIGRSPLPLPSPGGGEVAWFVSVWEVFVEQKWPLLPGGNYECK